VGVRIMMDSPARHRVQDHRLGRVFRDGNGTSVTLRPRALMIAGHQRLISPFLTRDHEVDVNYEGICSIYSIRFAVSDPAVALLTRDHGPSVTGTFTRSGTELNHPLSATRHVRPLWRIQITARSAGGAVGRERAGRGR
jgi:hypothetical protein